MNNTALMKGAGIWSITSNNLTLSNNTIANNECTLSSSYSYGGGLAITDSGSVIGKNNIFYANTCNNSPNIYGSPSFTYTCVGDLLLPGTGNISQNPLFATGISGPYYLSQIAAGQSQNSPCVDAGDPASPMITGTTRTDQVQDAGIVDMGYHYMIIAAPPLPVTITLRPVNPPIIIPAQGGSFNWDITLHNNESSPQTFDVWTIITLPSGSTRPGWGPYLNLTLGAGATLNRVRTQYIADRYPPGNYTYTGNVGDHPATVWDSDSFPFTKLLGRDGDWAGEGANDGQISAALTPTEYALHDATPNPFNPTTRLSYALPQAGLVKLMIYNASGREVVTLVNGWREAGVQEVTFDGSRLASGIYIYRISSGGFSANGKMVLMK